MSDEWVVGVDYGDDGGAVICFALFRRLAGGILFLEQFKTVRMSDLGKHWEIVWAKRVGEDTDRVMAWRCRACGQLWMAIVEPPTVHLCETAPIKQGESEAPRRRGRTKPAHPAHPRKPPRQR